jgi:hypothetical protein
VDGAPVGCDSIRQFATSVNPAPAFIIDGG